MIIREARDDDLDAVWRLRRIAFGSSGPRPTAWPASDERRLVAEEDAVYGYLRIRRFGQYFGGRVVPMGGLATVAVDPHARGKGVASGLLDAALVRMREDGQPLSTLFTTVPSLYRGRGWEQSGVIEHAEIPVDAFRALPASPVILAPVDKSAFDAMTACYRSTAVDGLLDRTREDLLDNDFATLAYTGDSLTGYLDLQRLPDRVIYARELIAGDPATATALLRSLGSWSGLMQTVRLRLTDPSMLALVLPTAFSTTTEPWYLRVVDFQSAIAARGWPAALSLSDGVAAELEIVDPHAPWHAGRHRLIIDGDQVRCEPGGSGTVVMHARALGPWYAGVSSVTLRAAGLMTGTPAPALDLLTANNGARMLDDF
ncbi:Predicted acetyltransferase [Amycolatopsis xylanica]|uniref:Predicted acetyltransferase n=1 Tax=Amycolatopsis xylanica TaxID=589385 RepID=A0A1H3LAQ1_9PSEU|nr:GNAT family N-acetyltransferase [Amycolatopsis xylanica]SDY60998.1 Predicted acetyltransferase [Amycolatopsis xylanica]